MIHFLLFVESSKVVKRGRVPKGFLSSNTAYMLVYKRVTTEWRMNTGKKSRLKKAEAETNSHDDITQTGVVDKDALDSPDEGRRKNGPDSTVPDLCSTEKIFETETENKIHSESIPQPSENTTMKEMIMASNVDSTIDERNGKSFESDDKEDHQETPLKKSSMKIAKVDYKLLNGAAHRAMSCGERDFYEEVGTLHLCFLFV